MEEVREPIHCRNVQPVQGVDFWICVASVRLLESYADVVVAYSEKAMGILQRDRQEMVYDAKDDEEDVLHGWMLVSNSEEMEMESLKLDSPIDGPVFLDDGCASVLLMTM